MSKVKISIVIGTYNRKRMLVNCIESIRNNGISVPYEIIVVDGGSDDGTHQWLTKQNDILTIIHHNRSLINDQMIMKRSWGYFMNLGFKSAEGEYICMLSDDCYIHSGAITSGYEFVERDIDYKIGGCAFPFRNSFIDDEFIIYKAFGDKILINHGIYRKRILEEIGWIDENNYRFYQADSDLSLRIWEKGYSITVSKNSWVEHLHNEFDPMRHINRVEADKSNDFRYFRDTWTPKFGPQGDHPIIEKVIMDFSVPSELYKYLPKNFKFITLFIDRYLKQYIKRESSFYFFLKRVKWALFRN